MKRILLIGLVLATSAWLRGASGDLPVRNVGGFTLVTNMVMNVDTTAAGIVANDVLAPQIEVANAVRTTGGTGILKCVTFMSSDQNPFTAFRLLVTSAAITWPATNAAANLVRTELATNLLGIVDFANTDMKLIGTNYFAVKDVSIGVNALANSIFIYPVCTAAITNTAGCVAYLKLTILQD